MNTATDRAKRRSAAGALGSPVLGTAPRVDSSVVVGPGRFEIAVLAVTGALAAPWTCGTRPRFLPLCLRVLSSCAAGQSAAHGTITISTGPVPKVMVAPPGRVKDVPAAGSGRAQSTLHTLPSRSTSAFPEPVVRVNTSLSGCPAL